MKTYKIGEPEMEERKIDFDFRHVKTHDHGNGMVTEIMACYMPTGTLFRICDCIVDEEKNVHVVAVNYQLDPAIAPAQINTDETARIYPVANIKQPYLEHEVENGEIEYGDENSPMDSSSNVQPNDLMDEDEGDEYTNESEMYIPAKDQEKLSKLLNAGEDEDDESEVETIEEPEVMDEDLYEEEDNDEGELFEEEENKDEVSEPEPIVSDEVENHYEEKPRKHYVNNQNNNPAKPRITGYRKKDKGESRFDSRLDARTKNGNRPYTEFENGLMSAISRGWN